jgi:raffinose/stachyose/melibiose transport system permease protein
MDTALTDRKGKICRSILFVFLVVFVLLSLYPIIWMFLSSFKTTKEIYRSALSLPATVKLSQYLEAWKAANFWNAAKNSVSVTVVSVVLIVICASLAAYAFSFMEFRWKGALYAIILSCQVVSAQVVLIPLFSIFKSLGVLSTLGSVIIAYTATGIPLSVLLLRSSFREIPRDIYESAKIDGSGDFKFYLSFIFPLSKPGIMSVIIYQSLFCWNEYLFALTFLNGGNNRTIPLSIQSFYSLHATDYGKIFAILSTSVIPPILLYLFLQKYFIRGVTAGAVKG